RREHAERLMQILVDVGNTRIKWAQVEDGRLARVGNAVHRDSRERALATFAAALPIQVTRAIIANGAGDATGHDLQELVRIRARITPEFVVVRAEQFGVRCAYA